MPAHCWDNIETADHRWLAAHQSERDSTVKTCIAAQVPECSGLGQKQCLRCQSGISLWQAGEYINLLSSYITRLQPSLCSFMLRMIGCHCTVQPARLRRPCGAVCWLFCASGLVRNRLLRLMISELIFFYFFFPQGQHAEKPVQRHSVPADDSQTTCALSGAPPLPATGSPAHVKVSLCCSDLFGRGALLSSCSGRTPHLLTATQQFLPRTSDSSFV